MPKKEGPALALRVNQIAVSPRGEMDQRRPAGRPPYRLATDRL